ncbi:hypothetical protein BO70DRAFT_396304 [Aspergillus heteromorphus CBS 117.55]|uniref:Folylpolyglutamate synthase n=1 Tax=Aspergillus heteromorphus CBS 117.55 TaxID=1448321 RepID=A0A317W6M6_9EURO|nr:uncharacterized protein BO70DRAFT_396304 [Aspergillus heteromorphus CBS 117.55]PWY82013.1 hypothetical protein BO70DRAFT_396304 [Aspergillus heteromorphus CBS 117.55]
MGMIEDMLKWCRTVGYQVCSQVCPLSAVPTEVQSPDFDPLNTVHIAGSRGKGSTSAVIAAILSEYQGPHVSKVVSLYGSLSAHGSRANSMAFHQTPLSEKQFVTYFNDIWERLGLTEECTEGGPPFARFLTYLLALHVFLQERVDSVDLVGPWFARKAAQQVSSNRVLIFNQSTRDAFTLVRRSRDSIRRSAERNEVADMEQVLMTFCAHRRGIPGEEMTGITMVRTVEEAVRCAGAVGTVLSNGEQNSPLVLITGSLHLIGSASQVLETLEGGLHL